MEIDGEIIKKAKRCREQFSCLSNARHQCCEVVKCFDNKICFVNCDKQKRCNYRFTVGYAEICDCPVRLEMYNKYHN